jgi:hypothetical protein
MSRYEVQPYSDSHNVGGYAIRDDSGRWIGRTLRLDKTSADVLQYELEHAFERGRMSEMVNG